MRRAILCCAAILFAVACGDNITEPIPQRTLRTPEVAFATTTTEDGLSISTDKDDYQPGDVVQFTGIGWQPGDVLDIVLTDDPQTHDPHTWTVTVDADGTFHDSTYVVDEGDLNVAFTLVTTSRATGRSLTVNFTDSQPQTVTLTPSPQSVAQGSPGTANYTVSITQNGNSTACKMALSVPGLPTGVSATFTGGVTEFTSNTTVSTGLTINTTSAVLPSTITITVQVARVLNCQGSGNTNGTGTLNVIGPAAKLGFSRQPPASVVAGASITPALTVQVLDGADHPVSSTAPITLAIGSNPNGGNLSGTLTQNAIGGVATFPGISIDKIGNGYTLTASSGSLTSATSNSFNITVGAASKLAFTTQPTGGTPGNPLTTQPVVQIQDAGGNLIGTGQGSGASITLGIAPSTGTSGAILNCTTNPLGATGGVATFAGCNINLAGNGYQLRASANLPTGSSPTVLVTSSSFNIAVVDAQAPIINCTVPDQSVWHGDNVTVPCTASDGSGLKNSGDAGFSLVTSVANGSEEAAATTGSRQVCDNLNNCATAGPYAFKVDRKDPTVSCGLADGNWHAADVSIACTAADGGSGISPASDQSFSLATLVAAGTENANASTNSKTVSDGVGHTATAGPIAGNKVDKKKPEVSCNSADGAWHNDNVSIDCTASDGGSGLANAGDGSFSLSTTVGAGSETNNASTGSRSVADAVGNSAIAGPISGNKVDRKAPTFSCGSADAFWHAADVSFNCSAADGGSGLNPATDAEFSLSTAVPLNTETNTASTGSKTLSDDVGNTATAGPIGGNKIDKKDPVVTLTCPLAPVILHDPGATASWTAVDGGSGVAGASSGTLALDASSAGSKAAHTAVGFAQDNVGHNSAAAMCNYTVAFTFVGLSAPVDRPTMYNQSKAGQAIPLKWQLLDFFGAPVTNLAAVKVQAKDQACGTTPNTDQIEEYASGESGLQNLGAGFYQFNWKTPGSYGSSCKTVGLDLGEGTTRTNLAYFTFKK
jgi:hypothetical protein